MGLEMTGRGVPRRRPSRVAALEVAVLLNQKQALDLVSFGVVGVFMVFKNRPLSMPGRRFEKQGEQWMPVKVVDLEVRARASERDEQRDNNSEKEVGKITDGMGVVVLASIR